MANPALPATEVQTIRDLAATYDRLTEQIGKVIIGQRTVVEQLLVALFSRGHCLLVGLPGLAKTRLVGTVSQVSALSFQRIQFTPDLMPLDITGSDILQDDSDTGRRRSVFAPGPLFANAILADGFDRAPPKTQAALLEAMQDGQISVGGTTYKLPAPFFVVATQNPIEHEGVYPLPAAQRDRFMFEIRVAYPTRGEEIQIVKATTGPAKLELASVVDAQQIVKFQDIVRQVVVADHVFEYVADLVRATRPKEAGTPKWIPELVAGGAGPRACQFLILGGKARAILHGRVHVTTDDIKAVAHPVLRHRILTTFRADADNITPDDIIKRLLDTIPATTEAKRI